MKRIVYTRPDGVLAIFCPNPTCFDVVKEYVDGEPVLDANGEPVLDINGDPVLEVVPVFMTIEDIAPNVVPHGLLYDIVGVEKIPADRTFRGAWKYDGVEKVVFDLVKCKDITHDKRRDARAIEFAPHDDVIAKQVPGSDLVAAENARVIIRDKYGVIQTQIDSAVNTIELKAIIENENL